MGYKWILVALQKIRKR